MKTCRKCGGTFTWRRKGEKWIPWGNGEPHWIECKKNQQRELEISEPVRITGENYRPECQGCPALPWESCACYGGAADRLNEEADERLAMLLEG